MLAIIHRGWKKRIYFPQGIFYTTITHKYALQEATQIRYNHIKHL